VSNSSVPGSGVVRMNVPWATTSSGGGKRDWLAETSALDAMNFVYGSPRNTGSNTVEGKVAVNVKAVSLDIREMSKKSVVTT